jgi:hypothetical protein
MHHRRGELPERRQLLGLYHPLLEIAHAREVAAEHFHIGHHVMPQRGRLGRLQMGEAGPQRGGMRGGNAHKGAHAILDLPCQPIHGVAHP